MIATKYDITALKKFDILNEGSTITQRKVLAEAFYHKPSLLSYNDDGTIVHNDIEKGFVYIIDEPIDTYRDIYPHPRTTMDKDAEFLTKRPLKVK